MNAPEADGTTALHWAVRADDLETTRLLLGAGARADPANRYGVTPLSLAALNGNAAVMDALLKAGADPAATVPDGETVLMTAARSGNPDAVNVLLARRADVNAREQVLGETALMWAAAENHADGDHAAREARRRRQRPVELAEVPAREVRRRQVGPLHRAAPRRLDAADVRGAPGRARRPRARSPRPART